MPDWLKIEHKITASTGNLFNLKKHIEIGGGDTNQAFRIEGVIEGKEVSFFIKVNQKGRSDMFTAEAAGLEEIENASAIRVPQVICCGVDSSQSYLVLEDLSLSFNSENSAEQLGQNMAALHMHTSQKFGWSRDNTIGSTEQINTWQNNNSTDSWITFWREQRLGFQLNLAKQNGASHSLSVKGENLLNNLDKLFIGYEPKASLLHGDLWSGNYGYLKTGEPVIFDPAVYYGDREADIAMTELFGGFPAEFYNAYNETWPLDAGYKQRKTLYNLYHILNHFNLFGGGYGMQAENMIDTLLNNS